MTDTANETDQASTTDVPVRLDVDSYAPGFSRALARLDQAMTRELDEAGIDHKVRELVRVRASQLNGCAYCVDMHTKDARAIGETEQRLYALPVWRDTGFYSPAERAALAFTEAVTLMTADHVPDAAYEAVAEHYEPKQLAALLALVVVINAWNGVGVTTHAWNPGSYTR